MYGTHKFTGVYFKTIVGYDSCFNKFYLYMYLISKLWHIWFILKSSIMYVYICDIDLTQ